MRSVVMALALVAILVTPAAYSGQVDSNNRPIGETAPKQVYSGPVDDQNRPLKEATPRYSGRVDENNRPLELWPDEPQLPQRRTADLREPSSSQEAAAGQEAVAAQLITFPATGDTRFTQNGPDFWVLGDYVEGVRNFTDFTNEVQMTLNISSNGLTCDTQDHALMIDGVTVGLFSINPGETQIIRDFTFPLIEPGQHTIRIENVRTVLPGCGCAGFPDDVSTLNFDRGPEEKVTFPSTGDPFLYQGTFGPWMLGDFIEGVRNLTEQTDEVEMMLFITNSLGCDSQDLDLMIDGNTVGSFSILPGETQIIRRFLFPTIAPGPHTFRLENVRTVAGGCGAAALPLDISMLSFFYIPGDKYTFPATGDTRVTVNPSPWNGGDYIEGVRSFTDPTGEVDMMLVITNNSLSCDTQDHYLMIDGSIIGSFSIQPGASQVNQSFTFPAVTAGDHTIRIETIETVAGGCGAAAIPDDVSMLRFLPPGASPGNIPPTLSVEQLGMGTLRLRWQGGSCTGAQDFGIYEGTLGSFSSHTAVAGHCSDASPFFEADIAASPGDTYYLVVPNNPASEGSYGTDSAGTERPAGVATCVPSQLLGCKSLSGDDAYDCLGNVGITVPAEAGLLANDAPGSMVTGVSGTAAGGLVAAAVDGSFTYDPPPGFTGVDSFTYDVDDGMNTDSATAFITVSSAVWFVDNTGAGGNVGTLLDPFLSLASFDAVNGNGGAPDPEAGDCVFLYTGTGTYTGGVTLENAQNLIGQGAGDSFETLCGLALPPHSNPLPATGGGRPTIVNAGGAGIALASNHTIRGLNIGDTLSAGLLGAAGNLTIREMLITGQGATMNLNNGTLDAVFDSLLSVSTAGLPGLAVSGCSGSMTVTGSTVLGSSISNDGISISGCAGAGFNFGSTTVEKSLTTGFGVWLNNNPGASFSFADLNIVTSQGEGLIATNSGEVILGGPNTINAVFGGAVSISNTEVQMVFQSLTSTLGSTGGYFSLVDGTFAVTGQFTIDSAGTAGIIMDTNPGLDLDLGALEIDGSGGNGVWVFGDVLDFDIATSTQIEGTADAAIRIQNADGETFHFGDTDLGQVSPVASGVDISVGNTGASFHFDDLDVTTSNGPGFLAENSGSVVIAGTPSFDATGGAAVDVTFTTGDVGGTGIWSLSAPISRNSPDHGIRFSDIAADVSLSDVVIEDTVVSGIVLNNISGTASVTHGSITFPGGPKDSDGVRANNVDTLVVQGTPGNPFVINGAGGGGGISAGHGVHASLGDNVTLLQLDIDNISDIGGAVLESGVFLEDISGSISVSDSTITHVVSGDAIFVENCNDAVSQCHQFNPRSLAGTLIVDITDNTLTGTGVNLTATTADGVRIEYETSNGGTLLATVNGNVIDNVNEGINVKLRGNGGTGGGGAHRVRIGGGELNLGSGQPDPGAWPNLITDFRNDGMDLSFEDSTVSKWFIRNNTVDAFVDHGGVKGTDVARDLGINWEVGGTVTGTSGTADLYILNNSVRDNADEGVRVRGFADPITATVNMLLQDNDVRDNGDEFRVEVGDAGTFNATVINNTAVNNDAGGADFLFGHRNIITGAPTLRVALFNNSADGYEFERTASGTHEIGCALGGSPACPLGSTTLGLTLITVLDKMGNASFGGLPVVVTSGASGSFIIVDEATIPGPTP